MAKIVPIQNVFDFSTNSMESKKNSKKQHYIDIALDEMKSGTTFIKVKSKSWRKPRRIELSRDHLTLQVSHQNCSPRKSRFGKLLFLSKCVNCFCGRKTGSN